MLKASVEFRDGKECISVFYENDEPPFDDRLMGVLRKDNEGFYRFHPARKAIMTVRHFRIVMSKMAELNGA